MTEEMEPLGTKGGDVPDHLADVNGALQQLYRFEPTDEMYSRGDMGGDVSKTLITWFAGFPPTARANIYVALALMATTDPTELNDAELVIYSFAVHDHEAVKAAEAGRVQNLEYGDTDIDGVLVDEDWYEDHVHHNGKPDQAKEYLYGLFKAETVPQPDYEGRGVLGNTYTHSQPDVPDAMMLAIDSGFEDPDQWGEVFEKRGAGEVVLDTFFEGLDWISNIAQVVAPIVAIAASAPGAAPATSSRVPGIRQGGFFPANKPLVPAVGSRPAVTLSNEAAFRNWEMIRANGRILNNATLKPVANVVENIPNWMRPFQYAGTRVGQPLQTIISNGATAQRIAGRPGTYRVADFLTRTRARAKLSIGSAIIVGSVGATWAVPKLYPDETEEGRQQMYDERVERAARVDKKREMAAKWQADTLRRETERRERARAMYPSTTQPEVTP